MKLYFYFYLLYVGMNLSKTLFTKKGSKSLRKFMRDSPFEVCFLKIETIISVHKYKEYKSSLWYTWQFVTTMHKISLTRSSVYLMYYTTQCSIRKGHGDCFQRARSIPSMSQSLKIWDMLWDTLFILYRCTLRIGRKWGHLSKVYDYVRGNAKKSLWAYYLK